MKITHIADMAQWIAPTLPLNLYKPGPYPFTLKSCLHRSSHSSYNFQALVVVLCKQGESEGSLLEKVCNRTAQLYEIK
jgi:hypothetical protein